jgi:hypothetical protein
MRDLTAALAPDVNLFHEGVDAGRRRARNLPMILLPADWHLRRLEVGSPLARTYARAADARDTVTTFPLDAQEAAQAVFVEVIPDEEWRVVLHVPPAGGRAPDRSGFVLEPSLARTLIVPSFPAPPPPSTASEPSGPELAGNGITTVLEFLGGTVLVVLAVATAPLWIPVLLVVLPRGGFSCGRPFRSASGRACTASVERGGDWLAGTRPETSGLSAADREELARSWLVEARAEHASIAAFSALSLDLMAVGAPPRLLERTHRAALDEVVHARICFALASAYAGEELAPGAFPEVRERRAAGSVSEETARLAADSLRDGCLVEGFAAALALEAERTATDPAVKASLSVIARDEARHVELAWSIVEWGLERGAGPAVAEALAALPTTPSLASVVSDRAALVAHGRHGKAMLNEIFAATRARVEERARGLLSSQGGCRAA